MDLLLGRARRRWIANLAVHEAVIAACAAMGGLILVLVAGTDLLDWTWILVCAAAATLLGFWRLFRRLPQLYAIAQAIDRRLNLQDSLSTAYFYARLAKREASEPVLAEQLAQARQAAAGVDLSRAVPFRAPRSLYVMAGLGLAASGLLTLRYSANQSLDLRPPLAKVVMDIFHFAERTQLAAKAREDRRTEELMKQFGLSLENEAPRGNEEKGGETFSEGAEADAKIQQAMQTGRQSSEAGEQGESDAQGISLPKEGDQGRKTGNDKPGASQQPSNQGNQAEGNQDDNSLLSKFKDALAGLMSKLKSQPKGSESQQMQASAQGRPEAGQGKEAEQNAEQAGMNSRGMPGSQGEGNQEGEGAQQASEGGQGKKGGRDSQQANREGRSGMGKEDGSKDTREAEQLAAMGKISEIIGKRSQNLTGEVTVEVTSSKQQLRTAYSSQSAAHAEAGGEIHRDEVPLAYQRYVQQYFEQIRKQPAPKPAEPGASGAKP